MAARLAWLAAMLLCGALAAKGQNPTPGGGGVGAGTPDPGQAVKCAGDVRACVEKLVSLNLGELDRLSNLPGSALDVVRAKANARFARPDCCGTLERDCLCVLQDTLLGNPDFVNQAYFCVAADACPSRGRLI
ncbi:hypothetical protein ACP4OV_029172 [Aristida adscensionis]